MCRCTPSIRTPYCENCKDIFPRKKVNDVVLSLYDTLYNGWKSKKNISLVLTEARSYGYIISMEEIDMAYMIFDHQQTMKIGSK